ncbi:MAG: MerC domain-containing protein [Pseudomonadota bacterium]
MTHISPKNAPLDATAMGMAWLCLIHCLALPLVATSFSAIAVLAEAEWIHKILALMALPLSLFAILRSDGLPLRGAFTIGAALGVTLLLAGAFVEAFHDIEKPLTVAGAVLLSTAHLWRWRYLQH